MVHTLLKKIQFFKNTGSRRIPSVNEIQAVKKSGILEIFSITICKIKQKIEALTLEMKKKDFNS